jgi:hypothetical protein
LLTTILPKPNAKFSFNIYPVLFYPVFSKYPAFSLNSFDVQVYTETDIKYLDRKVGYFQSNEIAKKIMSKAPIGEDRLEATV